MTRNLRDSDRIRRFYKEQLHNMDRWRGYRAFGYVSLTTEFNIVEAERIVSNIYNSFEVVPVELSLGGSQTIVIRYLYQPKEKHQIVFSVTRTGVWANLDGSYLDSIPCGVPGSQEVLDSIDRIHVKFRLVNDELT